MAIVLPSFEDQHGELLTVCGNIANPKKHIKKVGTKVARYGKPPKQAFVRGWIRDKKELYVHVDCVLKSYFPKTDIPKTTNKKEAIFKMIESVLGETIEAQVSGCFKVNLKDLPSSGLIKTMYSEQTVKEGVSMKVTGSTFSLSGLPIKEISWKESNYEDGIIFIFIDGETIVEITENYLYEMWNWINEQFLLFILGKVKNGKSE